MIPNRFHFVFGLTQQITPFHLAFYLCLESCLEVNQPDAIYFYYYREPYGRYWDLVKDKLIRIQIQPSELRKLSYQDRVGRKYNYAHQSDFIRLEKLLDLGGVYADLDTIFVQKIPDGLFAKPFVLGREDDIFVAAAQQMNSSLCNALIMAERNAAFGRLWQQEMPLAFDGSWSAHSTLLPQRLWQEHPDLIHVEPARSFYKHMWTRQGLHTLLEGCDPDYTGVISMHLWAHLWWSWRRRDFSNFHAGRLTEDFVRHVDTTYTLAARKFLPPAESRRQWRMRQTLGSRRALSALRDSFRELAMKAYVLTKLVVFTVLNDRIVPRASEHRDYARRQWDHSYIHTRFHPRTPHELKAIFEPLAMYDEYKISSVTLAPTDVVIDIGAHVGLFTYLSYRRGSRNIYSYEPEIENFRLLARSVRRLVGIHPLNAAVFRSDVETNTPLYHSGYEGENTGAGTVLLAGRGYDIQKQEILPTSAQQPVIGIPFDEILERFLRVRLVKLDCEGSEFPILLTSRLLDRVEQIIIEYHELGEELYSQLDNRAQVKGYHAFRAQDLASYLRRFSFQISVTPVAPHQGLIHGKRLNPCTSSKADGSLE